MSFLGILFFLKHSDISNYTDIVRWNIGILKQMDGNVIYRYRPYNIGILQQVERYNINRCRPLEVGILKQIDM